MALTVGALAVSAGGTVSGSGAARALHDLMMAAYDQAIIDAGVVDNPPGTIATARLAVSIGNVPVCLMFATWMVTEITTNAKAQITTGDAGLQRMPASTTEDTECKAPAAPKLLSIV